MSIVHIRREAHAECELVEVGPPHGVAETEIAAWLVDLENRIGAPTARMAFIVLHGSLELAVDDGMIKRNPAKAKTANRFHFYAEDSERFTGDRDLNLVRELNPQLQTFRDWLLEHKARSR